MKDFKINTAWLWHLAKKISLSSVVLITLSVMSQQAEAAVITYYYSEHCQTCIAFEPAWNEFVANESNNHTIKKKSTMDANNLQEVTQIVRNARGRVSVSLPIIYIEFEDKTPELLIGGAELQRLYQAVEPGTSKNLSYVASTPLLSKPSELDTSFFIPVTLAAAADAVNPCAIFVFVLAVGYATIYSGKRKAILYGITFASSLYLTYFTAGLAGKVVINRIFNSANTIALIMSGSLLIMAGLHLRTVMFPQKTTFSELSNSTKLKLIKHAEKCISVGGAATSGTLCAMIELPCTGGPYAFALSLLAKQSMYKTALLLGYYNLIFISPVLVLLCLLVISPQKIDMFERIRNEYKQLLHLAMAFFLTTAGAWGLWHYY